MKPNYALPIPILVDLAAAFLLGRKRSFRQDAARIASIRGIPANIYGRENIPQAGPGVITVNHYSSPRFWSPWIAISISALAPVDIYWTMTAAWTYKRRPFAWLRRWTSQLLLGGLAQVYGFNRMPPMPPAPNEIADRAAAVQRLIWYARSNPQALLGLAPEGGDQPGGILALPPDGAGRLALALARCNLPFYPVGLYEEADNGLSVCFGRPYHLEMDAIPNRMDIDLIARQKIMSAIAQCLPEHLRGPFRDQRPVDVGSAFHG